MIEIPVENKHRHNFSINETQPPSAEGLTLSISKFYSSDVRMTIFTALCNLIRYSGYQDNCV